MKQLNWLGLSGIAILLAGCGSLTGSAAMLRETTSIQIQAQHDVVYAHKLAQRGQYRIQGSAVLKDEQGKQLTCTGAKVRLYAATPYLVEYYQKGGIFSPADNLYISTFEPDTLAIRPHVRVQPYIQEAFFPLPNLTVSCKSDGSFTIPHVRAGDYFIRATILQAQKHNQSLREINLTRLIHVKNKNLHTHLVYHLR